MNLNRAMIIGNLTRDPELKTTTGGQTVCNFGVATNMVWRDAQGQKQERAEFHNVVAWGKLAEICGQYLARGRKVYVEGRLQTREWEGQDGNRRNRTEIVAENMILLDRAGSRSTADGNAAAQPQAASPSATPSQEEPSASMPSPAPQTAPNPDDDIKVEDIPF